MKEYTIKELANLIDHTNLKPYAKEEEMSVLCREAVENGFKMVAINQVQSAYCAKQLTGTEVAVGAAIAFPLGQTSIEAKVFETENAIANGATEIDYVVNLTEVKEKNYPYLQLEMEKIVSVCQQHQVVSKVIFENAYLEKSEIIALSEIAKVVKPDFIKTSTGFAPSGATLEDVALMKKTVGEAVKVKAAGGVRDAATFIKMIDAGAERIGTSSGISIIEEITEMLQNEQQSTLKI